MPGFVRRAAFLCSFRLSRCPELAIRDMLIALIQSKWDAGLKTVLVPSVDHRDTYLRKANDRADNTKP
jgi:hypothetical protein